MHGVIPSSIRVSNISFIEVLHHRVVDLNTLLECRLIERELGGQVTARLCIEEAKGEDCEEGVLKEEAGKA